MIKIEYALIVASIAVVSVKIKINAMLYVKTQRIIDGCVTIMKYSWEIKRRVLYYRKDGINMEKCGDGCFELCEYCKNWIKDTKFIGYCKTNDTLKNNDDACENFICRRVKT